MQIGDGSSDRPDIRTMTEIANPRHRNLESSCEEYCIVILLILSIMV
jgi:hypothetical protein